MFNPAEKSQYETIAPLGRGGMGEVFLAAMPGPPGLNQLAVLKRIWPELAHEPEFVAMFMDEARLALRMRHPNIVQTFEVGREAPRSTRPGGGVEPDRYYIAMEYLAGQTLAQVATRLAGSNAFGLQLRLQIVVDILSALEYAHQLRAQDGTMLGVVHRDISPQNVFVTYGGDVKLMDFGVAKSLGASHQTRPGTFKGRFAYAAPEQMRGSKVDRRSDLFSVGIILWELLTEQHLFRGRSKTDIVRILTGRDRLPTLPADWPIPERLRFVTARALALQPTARYQSAAAFRADLVDVQNTWLPPDPRSLSKVISCAFQSERESIDKVIEHHFDVNEEALTRVPIKPRITQPQISMPALGPPVASTRAAPVSAAAPRTTPAAGINAIAGTPSHHARDRSIDRVPFLESALLSLMTLHSRFVSDTLFDGHALRATNLWRRLRRSGLACGTLGLAAGALIVLVAIRSPASGMSTAAGTAATHAHDTTPSVEPLPPAAPTLAFATSSPPTIAPEQARSAPPSSASARVRPRGAPILATDPLASAARAHAERPARVEIAKPAAAVTPPPEAAEVPPGRVVAPARIGRPTLDTENPWGP
jgi:serine/threonine protein kinase